MEGSQMGVLQMQELLTISNLESNPRLKYLNDLSQLAIEGNFETPSITPPNFGYGGWYCMIYFGPFFMQGIFYFKRPFQNEFFLAGPMQDVMMVLDSAGYKMLDLLQKNNHLWSIIPKKME